MLKLLLLTPFVALADTPAQVDTYSQMAFMAVFIGLFYLLFIRPQAKRAKAQQQLVASLASHDEVLLQNGIMGTIIKMDERYAKVEISPNVCISVRKNVIEQIMPKGTIKGLN